MGVETSFVFFAVLCFFYFSTFSTFYFLHFRIEYAEIFCIPHWGISWNVFTIYPYRVFVKCFFAIWKFFSLCNPEDYERCSPIGILIFCDLSEKHLNRMLFELKSRKVPSDLKAILTPTNRRWTLRQLRSELERERASFTQS